MKIFRNNYHKRCSIQRSILMSYFIEIVTVYVTFHTQYNHATALELYYWSSSHSKPCKDYSLSVDLIEKAYYIYNICTCILFKFHRNYITKSLFCAITNTKSFMTTQDDQYQSVCTSVPKTI